METIFPTALAGRPSTNCPDWADDPERPRLDRFILGPELGRGGMGVVNLAWDPLLGRRVACKRLLHADPLLAVRFLREARIQAKVDHPRICKVYEVGSHGDTPFIAMQLVSGPTLGAAQDELEFPSLVRIMAEVAGAVAAAHAAGLVHRDLKPSNILLERGPDGLLHPCLLDFGLARDFAVADVSLSWGLLGTPAFMSPEQARGEELGPASDLYSLGATFFAVLAKVPPFEATTLVGLLHQHAEQRSPSMERRAPGVPKDLRTIVGKCLELDPRKRYPSAEALEADLRRFLEGRPVLARPVGRIERGWRWAQRHRTVTVAALLFLALSTGFAAWTLLAARRTRQQVAAAQRFGLQVRELDQMLRLEHMLPPHDLRPVEARIRAAMDEIRAARAQLGAAAEGPARYALGRGHLLLGEYPQARRELEAAWAEGHRAAEVAEALGRALLEQYRAETKQGNQVARSLAEDFRRRLVEPVQSYFRQATDGGLESPELAEARVALMEGDLARCRDLSRRALRNRPWLHEAHLLEAEVCSTEASVRMGFRQEAGGGPGDPTPHLEAAAQALQRARAIAPSDPRVYTTEIRQVYQQAMRNEDSGTPDFALFTRGNESVRIARILRPEDEALLMAMDSFRVMHGFALLRTGQDARPLMRETLAHYQALPAGLWSRSLGNAASFVPWILADANLLRGEDPRAAIAELERILPPGHIMLGELLLPLATFQTLRGMDAGPTFARMGIALESWPKQAEGYTFYNEVVWAKMLLLRAEWEAELGRSPLSTLEQAIHRLDASLALNAKAYYAWFLRARARTLRGRWLRATGGRGEPEFRLALTDAQGALAIGDGHWQSRLWKAEAHFALAEAAADPGPELASARQELAAGFKLNPTDFRLFRLAVRIELVAARSARLGEPGSLVRAEALATRGLAIKPDDPLLWVLKARALRLRGAAHAEAARACLRRALVLNPRLVDAQAEAALLDQDGEAPGRGEGRLQRMLARFPLQAWQYGEPRGGA